MCIILSKPAGKKIAEEIYRECWRINNDGVGIAYVCPEKKDLVVEKGFFNVDEAIKAIQAKEDLEMLIHFRKVSRGANSKENCHPFFFESEDKQFAYAVAHNGTFNIALDYPKSDTHTFVVQVLAPWLDIHPDLFEVQNRRWIFEQWMGERNKLVVMRYDRITGQSKTYILNEKVTNTNVKNGVWFSNYSCVPLKPAPTPAYSEHYGYGGGMKFPSKINAHSERYPDHLGWLWNDEIKQFTNETLTPGTKHYKSELPYRKPNEFTYVYEGKNYDRYILNKKREEDEELFRKHSVIPKQTNILTLTSAEDKEKLKDVTVPRDDDVQGQDDWEKDYNIAQGMKVCDMSHLTKKERKKLIELAKAFVRGSFGDDAAKGFSDRDAIAFIRSEYRSEPVGRLLTMKELDDLIFVTNGKGVETEREKLENQAKLYHD